MKTILEFQEKFIAVLGLKSSRGNADPVELLAAAIGVAVEGSEVLNELNKFTRPWKQTEGEDPQALTPRTKAAVIEESIDVLFYIAEIFVLFDISQDDVEREYKRKLVKNLGRVLSKISAADREEALLYHPLVKENKSGNAFMLLFELGMPSDDDTLLRLTGASPHVVINEFADTKYG